MRNKLKTPKDTSCQRKDQAQTNVVITLVSESVCSTYELSPERESTSLTEKERYGSDGPSAAGYSAKNVQQPPEEMSCCVKDIKIAPIFLFTKPCRSKRSLHGECQPVERQKLVLPSHREDFQRAKGQQLLSASTVTPLTDNKTSDPSTWKGQWSASALNICLQEIQTSNPTFPVRTVFSTLQKKASDSLQCLGSTGVSLCSSSPQSCVKEKRKRVGECSETASKRLKCGTVVTGCHMSAQDAQEPTVLPVKRSSKLSRTRRMRQQRSAGLVSSSELKSEWATHKESGGPSLITRVSNFEDVLWTDKYSLGHSSEVIGNSVSVNKLHSWLKKWKLRADSDERKKTEERKQERNDSWDCGDFQGEARADDSGEMLCNTMLITGPPGVGKTASVYACAQELGFKVFEVNCSSQRSGRHVLSQLMEATQSHLVETPGKDLLKPAYFKNYTTSNCTPKAETLPGKTVHPKNVITTTKKRATRNKSKGKANPATGTLASYFKIQAKTDHLHIGGHLSSEKLNTKRLGNPSSGCDQTVPEGKKTATSLILFEEVDVTFEEDVGFLAAIKTFMITTKRPVILTTNDPAFRERFGYSLEEIIFKTPPAESVCTYLQLLGLAENVRLDFDDVRSLLRLTRGDIRRCLLQLQLWVRSGGGQASRSGVLLKYSDAAEGGDGLDSQVPQCKTGCAASLLGLESVTRIQLLNHLKTRCWSETDMNKLLKLLVESWRGRVPLLYSNLELVLPTGAKETSVQCLNVVTSSGLHSDLPPSDAGHCNHQEHENAISRTVNSKHFRNISRLSRRKYNMNETTSSFSVKQRTSSTLNGAPSTSAMSRNKIEENTAKVETVSFDALIDFFDLMSYIDATLPVAAPLVSGSCRPETFAWTAAEINDGLLDEPYEEECKSWCQERLLNIQAAVEGLGCHKCCSKWSEAQNYRRQTNKMCEGRVVLPATSKRQSLRLGVQPLCAPSVSQQRYELSRAVLGSEYFSLLGNRQAVSVDYMPVLRSICRFQRAQPKKEEPVRCMNYLSGSQLGLSKSTLKLLAEDFS